MTEDDERPLMKNALKAGFSYFATVFAAGFMLGAIRTLLVEPKIGALAAVALEMPLMLAVSWMACGWALRRFEVDSKVSTRLVMSVVAFALLMTAELLFSMLLAGRSISDHLTLYLTAPMLLGLSAQLAYALFPLVRLR